MDFVILSKVMQTPYAFLRATLHLVLTIFYGGKGKVVPPVKNPLLLKSATKLAEDIREGKCKSEEVILAYIDRIAEVEPYVNATAVKCYDDAIKKAREADALIASGKCTKSQLSIGKPLLGVPITVKSLFHIKDMPCTGGLKYYSELKGTEDAPAVAQLKKAGAIVIATTNVPELSIDLGTSSKLYGTTCNPYDTNRTAGGSSGGEAALIGAGASLLGLGNDTLGSCRIPAHFCGIFAHKPTRGSVSSHGCFPFERPNDPAEFCNTEIYKYLTSGPMCRYAEDLITSMKVLTLDNKVRTKFDHHVDFANVKICYLKEIQSTLVTQVDQDIAAALNKAVSYFKKRCNTEPRRVEMPYLFDITRCIISMIDPLIRDMKAATIGDKGLCLNEKLEFAKSLLGKSDISLATLVNLNVTALPPFYKKSQSSFYQNMLEKCKNEFNELLDENTVLLMPTFPVAAPYHLEVFPLTFSSSYTALFNILGLPATHCPMGFTTEGLPCGIQVVGCQNNDPMTISCAVELEKEFGGWTTSKI